MKTLIIYFSRADENYGVGYIDKGNTEVIAEYIKEFTHCEEAAKELGFKSDESIRKACKETWRTSGGFKWMYKQDYEKMLEEQLLLS